MTTSAATPTRIKSTAITAPAPSAANHTMVLGQLKEGMEIAQRISGDPLDSYVRVSELVSALGARFVNGTVQPPNATTNSAISVSVINSITGSGTSASPLQLVGDASAPGNNMVYGTNGSGVKGWYAAAAGGSSPLTTKGDLYGHSTVDARIPVGSNGQVLTADSTQTVGVAWKTPSSGGGALAPVKIPGLQIWFESDLVALPSGGSSPGLSYLPSRDPTRFPGYASAQTGGVPVSATPLNGLPVMSFDGTTQNCAYNILQPQSFNQSTVFAVYKPTNYTTNTTSLASGATNSFNPCITTTGNLQLIACYIAVLATSAGSIPNGAFSQFNMSFDYGTGAYAFRISSAADSSGTAATGTFANMTTIGGNQQSINISTGYPNTQFMYGDLAAFIVYNRVLTLAEKQAVEAYLLAKWGV